MSHLIQEHPNPHLFTLKSLKGMLRENIQSFVVLTGKYLDELSSNTTNNSNDMASTENEINGKPVSDMTSVLSELVQVDASICSHLSICMIDIMGAFSKALTLFVFSK